MTFCGKTIAISLLLAASASSAVFADSSVATMPLQPTLMVLAGSDEETAVSLETVSSISALPVEETTLPIDASVEAGYPVLSFLFGRVPVPTPKPSLSERPDVSTQARLVRPDTSVPKSRRTVAVSLRTGDVAMTMGKRRIPSPMPPLIGAFR